MIKFVKGDLFESDCEALVNAVNTKGVMGRGIALNFKLRFPKYFDMYKSLCNLGLLREGKVAVYMNLDKPYKPSYIVSFPTKKHWKDDSKLEWIESGLKSLRDEIFSLKIKSIAIPALGCGLGGLKWEDVKLLIEKELDNLDCEIYVYEPC